MFLSQAGCTAHKCGLSTCTTILFTARIMHLFALVSASLLNDPKFDFFHQKCDCCDCDPNHLERETKSGVPEGKWSKFGWRGIQVLVRLRGQTLCETSSLKQKSKTNTGHTIVRRTPFRRTIPKKIQIYHFFLNKHYKHKFGVWQFEYSLNPKFVLGWLFLQYVHIAWTEIVKIRFTRHYLPGSETSFCHTPQPRDPQTSPDTQPLTKPSVHHWTTLRWGATTVYYQGLIYCWIYYR